MMLLKIAAKNYSEILSGREVRVIWEYHYEHFSKSTCRITLLFIDKPMPACVQTVK